MDSRGPSSGGTQALGAWAPMIPALVERRPQVHGLPWSQLWWNTGPRCMGSCGSSTTAQWLLCTSFSCSTEHGIFLDQGLNPSPLHWQADSCSLYHLKQWFWIPTSHYIHPRCCIKIEMNMSPLPLIQLFWVQVKMVVMVTAWAPLIQPGFCSSWVLSNLRSQVGATSCLPLGEAIFPLDFSTFLSFLSRKGMLWGHYIRVFKDCRLQWKVSTV